MKRILALFVLVSFAFYSCHKKEEPVKISYEPIGETIKRDFDYKVGTYWVYMDSLNGRVDSFAVVNSYLDSTALVQGYKQSLPAYNVVIEINEFDLNNPTVVISKWRWDLVTKTARLNLITDTDGYFMYFFGYPFVAHEGGASNGPSYLMSVSDSILIYTVAGNNYTNVRRIHHFSNSYRDSPFLVCYDERVSNKWFYVNADVGIIKMRTRCLDGVYHIWELLRSHIVK